MLVALGSELFPGRDRVEVPPGRGSPGGSRAVAKVGSCRLPAFGGGRASRGLPWISGLLLCNAQGFPSASKRQGDVSGCCPSSARTSTESPFLLWAPRHASLEVEDCSFSPQSDHLPDLLTERSAPDCESFAARALAVPPMA